MPHWPSPHLRPSLLLSPREPSRLVHEGLSFHTMASLPVHLRVPGTPTAATDLHFPSDPPGGERPPECVPGETGLLLSLPVPVLAWRWQCRWWRHKGLSPMDFPQGWAPTPTVLTWASAPSPSPALQRTLESRGPGVCQVSGSPSSYGSPGAGGLGPHPIASWDTSSCLPCAQRPHSPCISPKGGEWGQWVSPNLRQI